MKRKSKNKYRNYSEDFSKENSENKRVPIGNKSKGYEDFNKSNNKSSKSYFEENNFKTRKNFYDKNNDDKKFKSANSFRKNPKSSNQNLYLKDKSEIRESGLEDFIWGKHSVFAALENNRPINRIWCTSEIKSSEKFFILLREVKNRGVLVEEVSWSRLSQITRGAVHQGIALQVSYTKTISLDELITLSKRKNTSPVLICLDGITDPHNVGAIIRSAEAFGCNGVILPQRRSAGITGTVSKVAAGALEHIPVTRVVNLNRSLQSLKDEGFLIIGLTEKANIKLSEFNEDGPLVIVVGSENKGISLITQKYCDYLLKIPLKGKTTSLNASVAASIFINHLTQLS